MRELNNDIDNADREAKEKRNTYADKRRCTKEPSFKVYDQVLVRQSKRNQLTPRFDPRPYKITSINGTMITAPKQDKMVTRNSSHLKKFTGESNFDSGSESETDEEGEVTCRDNPEEIYDQPQAVFPRAYTPRDKDLDPRIITRNINIYSHDVITGKVYFLVLHILFGSMLIVSARSHIIFMGYFF